MNLTYNFVKYYDIELKLSQKIIKYIEFTNQHQLKHESLYQSMTFLSNNLKNQLLKDFTKQIFQKVKIFKQFDINFIKTLTPQLQNKIYGSEEIVINQSHPYQNQTKKIFILNFGNVGIFTLKNNILMESFSKGSSFGQYQFFTGKKNLMIVKTLNFASMFSLSNVKFMKILQEQRFAQYKDLYFHIRLQLGMYNNIKILGKECLGCASKNHFVSYCPKMHYINKRRQQDDNSQQISNYIFNYRSRSKRFVRWSNVSLQQVNFRLLSRSNISIQNKIQLKYEYKENEVRENRYYYLFDLEFYLLQQEFKFENVGNHYKRLIENQNNKERHQKLVEGRKELDFEKVKIGKSKFMPEHGVQNVVKLYQLLFRHKGNQQKDVLMKSQNASDNDVNLIYRYYKDQQQQLM